MASTNGAIASSLLAGIKYLTSFTAVTEVYTTFEEEESARSIGTVFTLVDKADNVTAYVGTVDAPKRGMSLELAKQSLTRVPDGAIYPILPHDLQHAAVETLPESSDDYYLKRPKIERYRGDAFGTTRVADKLLEEARLINNISRENHPHMAECLGYWTPPGRDGRMAGIIFRRYKTSLGKHVRALREAKQEIPAEKYMAQLRDAADCLYEIDVAHNRICTDNVMLDDNDDAVLISFKECKPQGDFLNEYFEDSVELSCQRNDLRGLKKVQKFLGLPVKKGPEDIPIDPEEYEYDEDEDME